MRKYNKLKRLLCFSAAVVLMISAAGCTEEDVQSSSSDLASPSDVNSQIDTLDPENLDFNTEQGAEVKAEELEAKEGKANGVDVSKWQGKIDWSKVKKSGIDFAIIRIGFRGENGIIYKDDFADYNIQQADKAGLLVGVYFFSTATNTAEAVEEAKWTVSAIEGYPISYPVVYDCEGFKSSESRMYGLSNSQRTDNALAFLKYVEQNGYEGMLYSAKNELEGSLYWDTARIENTYSVWVARYPENPYPQTASPDYGGKYNMWQYTDKGAVGGITGNADMSVSYFTRQKTAAKNPDARPKDAKAPTADDNIYTAVSDEVTAKIETNLRDAATTKSNIVGTLKNGTFLKRTATGSNGWSKLTYNGKAVYAITSYLTTDKNYKPQESVSVSYDFEPASGEVTAKDETNLRAEPNTNSTIVATIKNGEFVKRVGISPSGWTRVNYNGKIVYAKTSLLTTEINTASSENTSVSDDFEPASGEVTAK
ncbi:MAG: GH25 family lysozyme, partial [Acutalibacteraceae bacterium]|nr:GH25 family lysozyme [Acutalibacteraceae bacterium]